MKQYAVNSQVLLFSWIYLFIWIIAVSSLIILLARGSTYWLFPLPGLVFLYLWIMLSSLYPKTIVIGEDRIDISLAGSSRVRVVSFADLTIEEKKDYYELTFTGKGELRKYLVSKKNLPGELEQQLQRLSAEELS